jgi:hypothetical protein
MEPAAAAIRYGTVSSGLMMGWVGGMFKWNWFLMEI